jgi:hypothetical protein
VKSDRIDLSKIIPLQSMDRATMLDVFKTHIINDKGKINKSIQLEVFIKKRNLFEFLSNIMYCTRFLKEDAKMIERLFCFYHSITAYNTCHRCSNPSTNFNKNFSDGYYSKFCSRKCNRLYNSPFKNMSAKSLKIMYNKRGRLRRGTKFPEAWKNKLKAAASLDSVKSKKKQTCLKRYGVENPGVLGAFYSTSARRYIKKFLKERNIPIEYCLYHDPKNNKKEFFQMIFVQSLGKYRYFSYDLAVFENETAVQQCDLGKLKLILEYNGPWHYKKEEVIGHEEEKALPYKSNTKTKKEVFMMDIVKIKHAIEHAKEVWIYWYKTKELLPASTFVASSYSGIEIEPRTPDGLSTPA